MINLVYALLGFFFLPAMIPNEIGVGELYAVKATQ